MGILKKIINNFFSTPKTEPIPQPTPQPLPKPPIQNIPTSKTIKHKVAGVTHYKENILRLASKNPNYTMTKKEMIAANIEEIYEYNFKVQKTELIPEPTNTYDPNAIKVMVNAMHVGYIKKGSCKHILNLLNQNRIEKIETKICGGNYKNLNINDDGDIVLSYAKKEYYVTLSITEL